MKRLLVLLTLMCCACSASAPPSAVTSDHSVRPLGPLLLFLPGVPPSTTPPPGEVGVTQWSVQMNALNYKYFFIVHEAAYNGRFSLSRICSPGSVPSASGALSPTNYGPGTFLVVTSASTVSPATCVFTVIDNFGQKVSLSAGFPL